MTFAVWFAIVKAQHHVQPGGGSVDWLAWALVYPEASHPAA